MYIVTIMPSMHFLYRILRMKYCRYLNTLFCNLHINCVIVLKILIVRTLKFIELLCVAGACEKYDFSKIYDK